MAATEQRRGRAEGREIAGCNVVAQDKIWRDHIENEQVMTNKWPEKWGFMTTSYEELVKHEFPNREPDKEKRETAKNALRNLFAVRPATPTENYITVLPSTKPVPKTTAREVGWRSSDKVLALEKYGSYARPCGSILKKLNWPYDALD